MDRILIIGQALPAVKQELPYDTTMLYDWLKEIGISKEEAQGKFWFMSVGGNFPGFDKNGGHLKPSLEQMDKYWDETLEMAIQLADKVWVLGNVARDYIATKDKTWSCETQFHYTMHPSKRNSDRYYKNKETILSQLDKFLKS